MEEMAGRRLLESCGHSPGTIYGNKGCSYIRDKGAAFRHLATEKAGLLTLTDFRDAQAPCLKAAMDNYLLNKVPSPPRTFLFNFAVRELESWFLADKRGLAKFLGLAIAKLPSDPESDEFPKRTLVNLARLSPKTRIKEGLTPSRRGLTGPSYTPIMGEFIKKHWNIEAAMMVSPSLRRCVSRLLEL